MYEMVFVVFGALLPHQVDVKPLDYSSSASCNRDISHYQRELESRYPQAEQVIVGCHRKNSTLKEDLGPIGWDCVKHNRCHAGAGVPVVITNPQDLKE